MNVTVLLADDHPIVRKGMRNLLEAEPGFSVIGEAEDGVQAVQLAEKLRPNIMIVDMMMPRLNGLEVLRQLFKRLPDTRFIVLSMQSADPYVMQALKVGAAGYILKDTGPNELVQAIHQVLNGYRYLSPQLNERLIHHFIQKVDSGIPDPLTLLTDREREVLQMTVEGLTSFEIGEKLSLSPRTVESHRQSLMKKLDIKNQLDLVRFALKHGIVSMDD
jgi:DNA-binding NarL/FixJ family response regulator